MRTIIITLLILTLQTAHAQTGVLMQRYYIAGSLSLGQNNRAFSDNSAWLQMGTDTTDRGVLFPKVLLDSINTSARGLYVYDLADSVLYHFDGTDRVRYMTYKDTSLIKQLITNNLPDLSTTALKSDTARDRFIATYNYVDSIAAGRIPFSDTAGTLATRSFLTDNYFASGGNSFGVDVSLGIKDGHKLDILTNNTSRMSIFANGNVSIASATDAGYKFNVNGTARFTQETTLNNGLYFDNNSAGMNIYSSVSAGKGMSIGSYNSGYEPMNIKIGYNLSGSNNNKQYILNLGFYNDAVAANYYSTVVGSYNSVLGADAYAQVFGANNVINYLPNSVSEGTSIIGAGNQVLHHFCAIMGYNQVTTADNQLILAQSRYNGSSCGFNDVYFGTGPRSGQATKIGSNVTINGSGAGVDSNIQGGVLRLAAGKSTGAALPQDVIFATTQATISGTALQALVDRWYIKGETGRFSNNSAPTSMIDIDGTNGYDQLRIRRSYTPVSNQTRMGIQAI
ncbi:MAG: hypothetical protein H6550_13620 [Chitinophagales bacterium]|nr:hypothetical protein [Chitinophagales bacterium]